MMDSSSSSSNNSKRLTPIYIALDAHDYKRAVKLAMGLPKTDILAQALLAHAFCKSGQTAKCYAVLQQLFGPSGWRELEQLTTGTVGDSASSSSSSSSNDVPFVATIDATATPSTAGTTTVGQQQAAAKGKKGKGKPKKIIPSFSATAATAAAVVTQQPQPDVVTLLSLTITSPTTTTTANDDIDPPMLHPSLFADETIFETLSMTLMNLRLVETNYFLWKVSGISPVELFFAGIHLLLQYHVKQQQNNKVTSLLSTLQIVALQSARLHTPYTKWAAVIALWQLDFMTKLTTTTTNNNNNTDDNAMIIKEKQRLEMLPRLASSLAKTRVESAQDFLLLHAALQHEHDEVKQSQTMLEWLQEEATINTSTTSVASGMIIIPLGIMQRLELQASCYIKLQDWKNVIRIHYDLLKMAPDQWSYWKALIDAAYQQHGMEGVSTVVQDALAATDVVVRSHSLIHCQVAHMAIVNDPTSNTTTADIDALVAAIQTYTSTWATKASCTFSDIEPYITLVCSKATRDQLTELYNWASSVHVQTKELHNDRSKLRAYICSIQVLYKLVQCTNTKSWLPDWRSIVTLWLKFSSAKSIQKENQPADELVLLAVQGLLYGSDQDEKLLLMAATLLEMGRTKSPYNPYIKIHLLQVYAKLRAYDESWSLFRDLSIKHIQIDSCSYLILDHLLDGGMYQQACLLAGEILKFHVSALRETGDFIGIAMKKGNYSKADDFLKFQLERMTPSLVLLEARGVILDCAPAMEGGQMGITGQETDVAIANAIATEVHSTFGAPSLLLEQRATFSDNRDKSILDFQILNKFEITSEKSIVATAMRRKTVHGLLVRAVLVLDASKSPKKGKIAASSASLKVRSQSLLDAIEYADKSNDWINIMKSLCSAVLLVSSGMPKSDVEDSLSSREERVTALLKSLIIPTITDFAQPAICRFITDYLVAINALVETVAKLFALFGWSKLKQRDSVSALAKIATDLGMLVSSIKNAYVIDTTKDLVYCDEIIDKAVHASVISRVQTSRSSPRTQYVIRLMEELEQSLASFAFK